MLGGDEKVVWEQNRTKKMQAKIKNAQKESIGKGQKQRFGYKAA